MTDLELMKKIQILQEMKDSNPNVAFGFDWWLEELVAELKNRMLWDQIKVPKIKEISQIINHQSE